MKIDFYKWVEEKRERGEKLKLTALLVDVDNSPLLKMSAKKMIEDGFYLEVPNDYDLLNEETRKKVERLFQYEVNRYALNHMIEADEQALMRAAKMKAMAMELINLPNTTEEQKQEIIAEVEAVKNKVLQEHKAVLDLKTMFENEENRDGFISDGTVWFRDDKQLALDIIEEIEEVRDEEVNNIVTASTLVSRIDELLLRINATIERIDMFLSGEEEEIEEEIDGAVEMKEDDEVAIDAQEASKEKIEPTKLPDAKKTLEKTKEEDEEIIQENDGGSMINESLLNDTTVAEEEEESVEHTSTPIAPQ